MTWKFAILFCFAAIVIPLKVAAEEVADEYAVFEFLRETSKANRSLFHYGHIQASVHRSFYDEKSQKKGETVHEVRSAFKGEKVRLDWKEQIGDRDVSRRTVATEEVYKGYIEGDTSAYLRDPKAAGMTSMVSGFLPSRNVAFWDSFLERAMLGEKEVLSSKVMRNDVDNGEIYVVELVWKKDPENLRRFHIDPAKGGAVVKFQSYHDFGEGHILLRQSDAEIQPTSKGGWYLKRFTQNWYRPDKTLKRKEEIEIKGFDFTSEVSENEFTWEGMGLPVGTTIVDTTMGNINYKYGVPPVNDKIVYDVLKQPLVQEVITQPAPDPAPSREKQTVFSEDKLRPTDDQVIAGSNDKKNAQVPTSGRSVYLIVGVVGMVLLFVIILLAIRRHKSYAGGIK